MATSVGSFDHAPDSSEMILGFALLFNAGSILTITRVAGLRDGATLLPDGGAVHNKPR